MTGWGARLVAGRNSSCSPADPCGVFEGFRRTEIPTSGARILTVHGGAGPPLLLMDGNSFSPLSRHKIAPALAREFTAVATDLRGHGGSGKPPARDGPHRFPLH